MTLLITIFAAVISTAYWYKGLPKNEMRLGILCWLYWGASIMWFVDAIFEYREMGSAYFNPSPEAMLNDIFLALSVIALGLVIWIVSLLIRDPEGKIKNSLLKKNK